MNPLPSLKDTWLTRNLARKQVSFELLVGFSVRAIQSLVPLRPHHQYAA
jgi:hypothetical protein